jgi:plastocyanin
MNRRSRLFVVSLVATGACAEGPVAPASDAPDVVMSANLHAQDTRRVKMMDTCDTETFDAVIGAGTCVIDRGTTFDQFIHQLTQQQTVQSWRNNPQFTQETVGTTLEIRNDGGETHTFTRVAQFGGGFIVDLNLLSGNLVPAPECLDFATIGFVPSGGSETQVLPAAGPNHYMCCIHPWMRTTIVGR